MSDKQKRREFLANGLLYGTTLAMAGVCLPRCLQTVVAGETSTNAPTGKEPRALENLAYCGFDCQNECELYKETQTKDLEVKKATAKRWAEKYGISLKPEEVACDGCRSRTGRLGYHCAIFARCASAVFHAKSNPAPCAAISRPVTKRFGPTGPRCAGGPKRGASN